MEYNEHWTREKHIEYRKLKIKGYTDDMLKEHFGESIYHSGRYNKNSNLLPWYLFTEIKINPIKSPYDFWDRGNLFCVGKKDYFARFISEDKYYILCLMYYEINDIPTYNVIFTTEEQWNKYDITLKRYFMKGYVLDIERDKLKEILERKTNLNDIYGIMKRLSFIVFDIYENRLNNPILSIGDTVDDPVKIRLYRNIIKDSFDNVEEVEVDDKNHNKYYLYKIIT